MVKMLLGLDTIPKPHDATDALAVAICHLHNGSASASALSASTRTRGAKGVAVSKRWRDYRPAK